MLKKILNCLTYDIKRAKREVNEIYVLKIIGKLLDKIFFFRCYIQGLIPTQQSLIIDKENQMYTAIQESRNINKTSLESLYCP